MLIESDAALSTTVMSLLTAMLNMLALPRCVRGLEIATFIEATPSCTAQRRRFLAYISYVRSTL